MNEGGMWTGFIWLKIGSRVEPCENGNESSSSIKAENFLITGATITL
jgi:hypothetical protein